MDEIFEHVDFSPSEEAQDIAYAAMEASDPFEALDLSRKALDLDPDCVDAFLLMTKLTCRSLSEQIIEVKKITTRAEQKLGQKYFEKNKGHFWGLIETRPYMRARSFLVAALREMGKTDEAVRHAEEMLEEAL